MPIYTVKASDGNLYKVDAPEGTTQEQVFAFVSSQMAMRQRAPESAGFNLGDLAASFAQSAYGSTQALTDVFGAGNVASRALEERVRASQAGMSVARQAELARQQERLKRAEASGSALEEAKAVLQNIAEAPLQSAAQALGSFAPYIPTMFLGPAAGVLGLGARATAAATNVAKAAPAVIGTAQGAGAVKGAIYDAVYEAERKDGVGEEEARAKAEAAQSYAGDNIDQILLGSGAGYVAGRFGAERLLTPGAAAKASQSVAGRIATAAATDVPTEAFQGGQERLAANLALQREGRDVPTFEGVAGQATQEGLLGLLGSAPVAALRGPDVEALRQEAIKKQQAEFEAEKARALEEMASHPPEPEKPIELPQGYKVMREELGREVGPESYGIFVEGQETPLTTVASEQQALQKIESFKEIRESERETLVEQMEKLNDGIQKTRDRIDYLEATGKTADPEYTKLKTALPDQELAAETKARELAEQVQQLGAPLTFAPIGQKETVREQYNVLSPTNEPIGTFATAGEAEASVRGIIGDEPFKQAEMKKQRDERIVSLEQQLVPKLKQFGLQDVGLKVVESIENNAGGAYLNKLIRVAYDEANPLQTMRHESLHALKDLGFFTPQQWKALNERAEKQWVQELKNVPFSEGKSRHDAYVEMFTQEGEAKGLSGQQLQNYVRETLNEEAIADAFGAYDRGATPPPGMIAALFKRLKNFFLNFGQALRGAGFESADDIFQRVERGELRGRKPAEAEEKLSLRVANKVAKQLNLGQPEIDSTSISLQTGKAGVEQFKKTPVGGLPKVVEYLEKRRLQSGLKPLDINNEEDREELAKLMAAEAMAAINAGGNALEWYDSVIDSLMQIASLKYKELATDEDMRSAFRMAIAIASQGLNVEDNLTFAMSQYDYFRNKLRFKELGSGSDGAAMKSNFILANQMIEQYTLGNLRRFLQTEFAVEELRDAGFEIGGELGDEKVTGSAIFGPKIGFGFYSNLSGNFEPVTMDMWFMRTVGRLTGKLKGFDPVKFGAQLERFRNAFKESGEDGVYADEFKQSELQKANESVEDAVNLARVVNSVFNRDFINNRELYNEGARKKSELVYAAQNIIKSYDAPKDAPQNGTERRLLRDVVARTVDKVAKAYGKRIPPASLQALIWYPEQELYKALGVKLRVTSQDYAGAIKKILTKEGYDGAAIDRAAKSGPRAVQPVAGQQVQAGVTPAGKKPQTAFEPAEREEFLEERRTERVVKQEREAPRRKKVIFEVAPDPNDVDLANSWRNLPQEERLNISEEIAKKIIARSKSDLDFDGRIVSQVGSYLDDTNPSFALFLESGDSVEIAKYLGFSLSQDSMMVVSPKPGKGLEEVGAVVVDVGTQAPSKINDIYQSLREIRVNNKQPVGGQTTMNNKMIILNYSDVPTEELANLIDQKLGGNYDVEPTTVYSAFPEKVSYDYASEENDPRGKGKIVRERARSLRAEATELLRQALGGEGKAAAKTGDKKYSLRAPTSPNFKRWFGDSKIVNEDGTPMVMYHGLAKDTTDFTRKTARGAPIFLTDDPEFAVRFAVDSYESVARNPQEYLSKEQIDDGVKRAIAAIKKDYGKDSLGKEMVESLQTGNLKDATPEAREYIQKEFINLLPTGPHIMPLYVRAERPFDYQNPSHIRKVLAELTEGAYDPAEIRSGSWELIESADFQDAIQSAGFDSFYVKEHGRKNLAVYDPNQVKSATGNVGTFSRESADVRYSLKNVAFPSAKEAQEAADGKQAPNTKEFKLFIGASRWLDEDGNPKKFFHATAGNFSEFLEGRIYLSETAKDSEKYGYGAEDRLRASIYRALNKDEKLPLFQRAVDEAVKEGKITAEDGNEFMRQVKRKIPDFGKYNAIKEEVDAELIALSPERMKIMPLYARSETPFDFRNSEHVYQVSSIVDRGDVRLSEEAIQEARRLGVPSEYPDQWYRGLPGLIKQGYPKTIESPQVQKAIRKLGFDGYIVRHNRNAPLTYVVYDNNQVKSVTGNLGDYSLETKDIRYSLPVLPQAMETRIGETTFRREPEGFFERITEAISPKNFSYFRQRVLNQYNQLGVYDRKLVEQMGGKELLADQSAEAAALMSDLGAGVAASAMGFGDRNGGIPVYKNGVTTIDRSKKGLIAVLQPLARYGDPKIYQYYQYWAMVKRGVRLNAEGKETGIDNTDVQYAKYLQDKFPEFVTVQKEFIEFNNGLVKYARDTGVISEQNAEAFMRYADYVPFYRQMDGETTVGPNIFQSIAGVKPPKKLKGGTAPLADFLETAVRNTQSMIQAGVKNAAAQRAVGVVTKVKAPGMGAERLDYDANGPDVFHVLENGKRVSYRTPDVLLIDAISSLHLNEIPGLGIIATPANALRNLVTKDPGFMMANLMRDSLSAWVTSGQKMTPIAGTVINFGKALAKKSKGYEALLDAGVIGGYEFSQNIERSGRQLEEDLSEKAGKKAPLVLRPFKSLWGALERGTEASDAATRALVYERVLNDTGNEAEALFRALEVMNFNRKGNSPLIRILTAGVPFLNARMQGLDLFYRASTGNMNMADKAAVQRKFWLRGSTMMAISAYYWMMVHDEDDYKSQEQETKDNNWIIPSLGIRIPIPFEVGVLFKTIPERIMAYSFGNDTGKDFTESMKRNFMSTFAFNPIPQVVKPVLEAAFNFNPFTWRQIVGQGMQDVAVEYQVGPGTSKIAKAIGENLGLSPMKVDHIIKGYTGTMGMYAIDTIDYIMDQFGDSPKAAKRFEQMPVIKRFAVDPAARGTVTAYYEMKDSVDTTVRTMNLLERTMEPEKFAQYVQDNLGPLAVKDYIRDLERTMKELREMRLVIQSSTMSAEEKRDGLLTINQAENNLTKNIQEVKKAIASLK